MDGLSMTDALLMALSGFVIVFIMLACLWFIIVAVSRAVGGLTGKTPAAAPAAPVAAAAPRPAPIPAASAPVTLTGVDDLTAACIMAIVSNELGTTPDQLTFRAIKAL